MPTLSEIVAFLEKLAPPALAEDWDNTGLLVGRASADVRRILTCLTLTPDVAKEAIQSDVQLIVSHHPVLFRGTKRIADDTAEGRMLLGLIESGIAVYSPHTSFDSAADGINQQLAESFGLQKIQPLRPSEAVPELGSGRIGTLAESVSLSAFLGVVSAAVAADYLEYTGPAGVKVSQVAVACGAAGEFLADAIRLGCDTFVTGEGRFHSALEARSAGVNLIFTGHYSSERPAVETLASAIADAIADVKVWPSQVERDPLTVYQP